MKSIHVNMVAILVLTAALTATGQEPSERDAREENYRSKKWRVQAGWVHQFSRGMSVSGPAPSLSTGLNSLRSGAGLTYPDNRAFIPRTFDDGYVRPDMWTGDAGLLSGPNPERHGMTWNWGADNASQYNYDGGAHPSLSYHIDRGGYADSTYKIKGGSSDDDFESNGVEIKARRLMYSWTDAEGSTNEANPKIILDLNLVVGMAWFPRHTQSFRRAVGQDLYTVTETYTYQDYYGSPAGGSWGALDVPYAGTYGSATEAGPLIPVTPESSAVNSAYQGKFVDSVDIKSKVWHLRGEVGVEFVKPVTDRLDVYVSPQAVLEFVDMDAERNESVTYIDSEGPTSRVASRTDKKHKTTVVPGILLTAGVDYRFSGDWYAGASLGWEELAFDPSVRVGPNKVKYDLGGAEASLYLGYRF